MSDGSPPGSPPSARARLAHHLGLERNAAIAAGAMFLMGCGEELWKRFLPKYLTALGAPVAAIGAYGTARDLMDGLFQYPGGWVSDHFGRRRALQLFVMLAAVGYAIYLMAPSWPFVVVGLGFVLAWSSAASPTLFAIVGDALPKARRTMGFAVQSILRRVPIMVAPVLGAYWIATHGTHTGVRIGLAVALVVAAITFALVSRIALPVLAPRGPMRITMVWRSLSPVLRRLLASDVLVRTCEALADVFIVLYAIDVIGVSAPQFAALVAIQMGTAIAAYLPAVTLVRDIGRKPFVIATFVAFALFPLAIVFATGFPSLVPAFIIGGLREIGEPARKALIVDLADPHARAQTVGVYYLIRGLAISPAAVIGGLLWGIRPSLPFIVAGAFGAAGVCTLAVMVRPHEAA